MSIEPNFETAMIACLEKNQIIEALIEVIVNSQ